jgi:radical SAM superfamily enzyme YgiQ (UPF0313 family)
MNVAITYPPIESDKGVPLLSQNRQFQWFNRATFIYPMVPASAATLAKQAGHSVAWLDGIAEGWNGDTFMKQLTAFGPDVVLIETKTPVIRAHWQWITRIKQDLPDSKMVLVGDHVTALPEESFANSKVDYILTGGDYDYLLVSLLAHLARGTDLEAGTWFRMGDSVRNTGAFVCGHELATAPFIDRELTRWKLYSRENGNFKYLPGTYTMAGRDCWWGKCTFCSWTTLYNKWRTRPPESLLDEIGQLLERYPIKEIFDDTGCFPAGQWLRTFCEGFIERGYHRQVVMGCNMIPGVLDQELYDLMGKANFRFVLFGLESADQSTLDRVNKCGKAKDIEASMKMAKRAGLEPHVTCMVGYPWETREQAQATIDLTRRLFDRGHIDSLQATVVIPYPGTPLFKECRDNGWLKTEDWDRYDMREPIMTTEMSDQEILEMTRGIYKSFLTPRFVLRKLMSIRRWADLKYYVRLGIRVLGHLLDFKRK